MIVARKTPEQPILLSNAPLTWPEIVAVARYGAELKLSETIWARIENSRAIVEQIIIKNERAYGINTGLGALSDIALNGPQLAQLSKNTLLSHACGVGPKLATEQTRAIICAAINNFALGYSGISSCVVKTLIDMLNAGITPVVPSQGSVGYLIHMAHVGVALLGVGNVEWHGEIISAEQAFREADIQRPSLGAKDGLSLVNGTPCMTGLSCLALADAINLAEWADIISAMSFEALRGQIDAFDETVMQLKPHVGMQCVGKNMRSLLSGSDIIASSKGIRTQDALSIRSIPQIHGACRDQLRHAEQQINTELASATDNPLIVGTTDSYRIFSQANPHGESVAMAADLLCMAVAELAGVAERRLDRLVNPLVSGLPAFLVSQPGVNSGMMITQYVAASLVSESRHLSQPAVIDNFVTSALQEDHLSFGTTAVLKLLKVLENSTQVLAIEYLLAGQAFEFFNSKHFGEGTLYAWQFLRKHISAYDQDRWLAPDLALAAELLRTTRVNAGWQNECVGRLTDENIVD